MEADEREVAAGCPSALVYAPRDAAFEELGAEMGDAEWDAGFAPVRSATEAFARATESLSWSERRLTRLVRSEAAEERAFVALLPPDVCASVEAWKASDYAELPPGVGEFVVHTEQAEPGSFEVIMRLLSRYEVPAERRSAKRTGQLEALAERRVEAASKTIWRRLEAAMGVSKL
jgi:hypothetical protein